MPTADQLIDLIRPDFDALNDLLISQLGSDIDLIEQVSQYLIQSGGKRVRPLVTLMAARALNTQNEHHIPLAASIECLHTATLFHDDVVDSVFGGMIQIRFNYNIIVYNIFLSDAEPFDFAAAPADIF